jgi:hypothetical protein
MDPRKSAIPGISAKLAGASLLLNNVPAALYYASPTQNQRVRSLRTSPDRMYYDACPASWPNSPTAQETCEYLSNSPRRLREFSW